MALKHSVVKIAGQKLLAVADWNAEHTIDGNNGEVLFNDAGLILTDSDLFWDNINKRFGVGTNAPTQPFSVKEKCCMTAIGGFAIKLTNKTGVNSVAGKVVKADGTTNDAVDLNDAMGDHPIGVFLDSGIIDGSETWVVVSGIADVMFDDDVSAVRGQWVGSGVAVGYARTQPNPPAAWHGDEIGHCIENVTATGGGTHILGRVVLHFN